MGCVWIVRLYYCGFELAGATLSPTRISRYPEQSPFTGKQAGSATHPHEVWNNGNVLLKHMLFYWPWINPVAFWIMTCVYMCILFDLCASSPSFPVNMLVSLVTLSSYTELISTSITPTNCVCWNGLRLFFNVLLFLDPSQLFLYLQYLLSHWELHWKPLYHISITDAPSL